jgi:hypothetical protein
MVSLKGYFVVSIIHVVSSPNLIIVDERSGTLPSNFVTAGRSYLLSSIDHPFQLLEGRSHRRQMRAN